MTQATVPLKRLATIKARVGWKGLTSDEFEVASYAYLVTGRDFQSKLINWRTCYQVSRERFDDDPFIQLADGDLLVTKDGTIGKVALVAGLDKPACLNSGVFVVRPHGELSSAYLYWVLQSGVFTDFIREVSRGSTIQHLYQEEFRELRVPLPKPAEQRAIADFLDREAAQIDAFIAKSEELITLLTERRAAVIARAFGDEWPTTPLRALSTVPIQNGVDAVGDPANPSDWPRYLRTTDIASLSDLDPEKRVTIEPALAAAAVVRPNDLLLTRAGATIGKSYLHVSDEICSYAGYLVRVRPDRRLVLPWFLAYWTLSRRYLDDIRAGAVVSTIENFSASKYRAMRVPLPPLADQAAIVASLNAETGRIDAALEAARRGIELAHERRAALISAAVTGKISVGVG
ncbi:restriction endonuclease subunit S [Demequina sp. SYSU T00039]|uniref:Restriction endonuclease subunit S n=1 Tax=Demequina lignilytica TaxID=3051663 RepID=A0AAW7M8R3_9MICO|nr:MULTISPECIES: restriction endonuclease subunit S [unclassified Demequina]MDN4478635.1 restriction endonuclease subunit S [Demequina sp. SYSU T00039-1]MDN4488613.1 restriction endonuclease subunit S [Demequina sp. SYSU T00039]